ncbi:MAG: [FeFe] hydrogenase, group A [Bacteroidales bacterium]|nr:[FeFe] hydrogenase, group A [Bacteroidales bacterium]
MIIDIEVNNKTIKAKRGETILSALNSNGIKVPTLCHIDGFVPTGACRICVVEVEGKPNLIPSCSYPVEEWMKIKTHSQRVIKARKTIVELLLANHPNDCLYCERNGNCELQKLAEELNIRERKYSNEREKLKIDPSCSSIIKESDKCILCGRCIRVCEEIQGITTYDFAKINNRHIISTSFNKPLNISNCILCGQCIMVCPTGALHERNNIDKIQQALNVINKHVVVFYSPTISVSLAEEFNMKPGKNISGIINAALRKIGFNKVFDSTFATDVYIIEQTKELIYRIENNINLPLFTSNCPAWIKYAEEYFPEILTNISKCKSPQQIMGSIVKEIYSEENNIPVNDIITVSIEPCTAKKFESQREEMTNNGISDVDIAITTRELAQLIRLHGIDLQNIEEEIADFPYHTRSSAGKLTSISGGTAEAILRTLNYKITGKELEDLKISELRNNKSVKEIKIKIGKTNVGIAVISSMSKAGDFIKTLPKRKDLHLIEIMACPCGCVNGGGQPIKADTKDIKSRIKSIYDIDRKELIKVAHKNPQVIELYSKHLDNLSEEEKQKVLFTNYSKRDVLL